VSFGKVPVIVLAARADAATLVRAVLEDAQDIEIVALTPNVADLVDLCARYQPSVLVVCTGTNPQTEVITKICAENCESLAGMVIVDVADIGPGTDLSSLPHLVRRIGEHKRTGGQLAAYYF